MVAALLGGCGSGDRSAATTAQSAPILTPAQQARADARAQRRGRMQLERTFAPNPWRRPGATTPHDTKLHRLIVHEVKPGRGPALTGRERVYADYVKTYWRSGRVFLTAWGPHRAEYLDLASQAPGISRGMKGMRPGGRRTIAMPGTISDVHNPNGGEEFVSAQVDIVLRSILPAE